MKIKFFSTLILAALTLQVQISSAFCGFYVAKADATLFNNKSEVILVRDGLHTVITMSNDFKGEVRDFAMVVPVPVVLKESDIRVVDRRVFDALDAYSSPRLVEYYDNNPCQQFYGYDLSSKVPQAMKSISIDETESVKEEADFGVTIEAKYTVGEYDILLLSATQSTGLKDWLIQNGYKIPSTADEVLQPYIKSNMKFFVVKVNLDKMQSTGYNYLRPIQISFDHEKFMLPIRLGMANSQGNQDLIVYAFTRTGRVECTNYRTIKMPTDRNVPLYVQPKFGEFYKDLYQKTWRNEGGNGVFLEYAWNVSPFNAVKCDPCVGNPPYNQDFVDAGISWLDGQNQNPSVFFTRMHVRYNRGKFPADLQFQVTPNMETYQCRYILTHPAYGAFDCDEGQVYVQDLMRRRKLEVDELMALTGWSNDQGNAYINEYAKHLKKVGTNQQQKKQSLPLLFTWGQNPGGVGALLVILSTTLLLWWSGRRTRRMAPVSPGNNG